MSWHERELEFERRDGWLSGFICGLLFSAALVLLAFLAITVSG